jgi:hypothetical protein
MYSLHTGRTHYILTTYWLCRAGVVYHAPLYSLHTGCTHYILTTYGCAGRAWCSSPTRTIASSTNRLQYLTMLTSCTHLTLHSPLNVEMVNVEILTAYCTGRSTVERGDGDVARRRIRHAVFGGGSAQHHHLHTRVFVRLLRLRHVRSPSSSCSR